LMMIPLTVLLSAALLQSINPIRIAVPGAISGEVTLLGIEAIDTPECAGVVAKEIAMWNIATKIVEDSKIPAATGVYVEMRNGKTLNELAVATGCARVSSDRFDLEIPIRNAWRTAQALQRGAYKVKSAPAETATVSSSAGTAVAGGAMQWSGGGSKDTESFEIGGEWKVVWSGTATSSVGGVLHVVVHDAATGRVVGNLSSGDIKGTAQDQSVVRTPPGRYYLSINSANLNWRIIVTR
jgi:hypothetical protein